MNLTIRHKIFLSYAVMICFTLIVGSYAISSLRELKEITTSIATNYVTTAEKLTRLNDSILAQDLYEKRSLLLGQPDAEEVFWSRSRDFRTGLEEMVRSEPSLKGDAETIAAYHNKYNETFKKELSLLRKGMEAEAREFSSQEMKDSFDRILGSLRDIDVKIKSQQNHHISKSNALSERALTITIALSIVSLIFGIFFASLITNHLNTSIVRLKEATRSIRVGDFDNIPEIKGSDELAELAVSFREMSARLKELEATNLDANPLTKLPGNLAIEKELLTRLNEEQRFSFCLIDLDNFKAYNDRYSYARGSDLLTWFADLLVRIREEYGTDKDFLGHIGGDDFILICSPDVVATICAKIIEEFDRGVVQHYDPEDAKKGFIISIDRNDKPAMFGIMTVSIAVVNTDRTLIRDPREVTQKVTELKQYAKNFAKSIYIMDRRRSR